MGEADATDPAAGSVDFEGEIAKLEGLIKEAAISDVVDGHSANLRLVTLEECEYKIKWDAKEGLKILTTK